MANRFFEIYENKKKMEINSYLYSFMTNETSTSNDDDDW